MRHPFTAPVFACLLLTSCAGTRASMPPAGSPLEAAAWLSGSFASTAQAEADPENFVDIRLHAARIWPGSPDGVYLYVEQASAASLERPYRQRVYLVSALHAGGLSSRVYLLPGDALAFAGAYATPERFDALGPGDLTLREGCTIYLERTADGYVGATRGSGCVSQLAGAAYATSEVVIGPDRLSSWDRGFDAEGKQVWGATEGPYVFVRQP